MTLEDTTHALTLFLDTYNSKHEKEPINFKQQEDGSYVFKSEDKTFTYSNNEHGERAVLFGPAPNQLDYMLKTVGEFSPQANQRLSKEFHQLLVQQVNPFSQLLR